MGRIGELSSEIAMVDYLPKVKEALCSHGLRYYDAGIPVKRVAVLGGSGGDYLEAAYNAGCDTFITADVKYDVFLTAKALSINLIDGDHFCTENVVVKNLYSNLYEQFSKETNIIISSKHGQTTRFF